VTGVVRDAGPDDLDEICALIVELARYEELAHEVAFDRDELAGHLFGPSPAARVLIAEVTDAEDRPVVAGFALWFTTFSTFLGRPGIWLEDLFVRPEHRGCGLGRALIEGLRDRTDGAGGVVGPELERAGHRLLRVAGCPAARRLDHLPLGP